MSRWFSGIPFLEGGEEVNGDGTRRYAGSQTRAISVAIPRSWTPRSVFL